MSSLKSSGDGLPAFENDFSADSNPYAYPYFHCNGTSPLIYELVVQFARHWNELSETTDSVHVDTVRVARAQEQLEALVRQIHKCCKEQPAKASWRDSCGDTALHRLCQVARFPSLDDTGTVKISFAQMLVSVAEALVDAHEYPGAATRACNNWKETPLHQFCSHCAFPNNNIVVGDGGDDESLLKHVEKNPMLELLKLLSRDGACSLRNCWGSFPLHDACGLPGWELPVTDNDSGWKRPHDTSPFLKWMKQQHGCMIHFLISQNVKAVGLLRVEDGQTPLYRAFQSLKCSADVIETVLSHMDDTAAPLSSTSCLSILWKHYEQVPPLMMDFDPQEQAENLGILWQTTVLALQKVSCHGLLVHSTVTKTNGTYCPLHVVQLAARLYPQQLLQKDKDGNTPLSLAIQNTCSADIVNALLWENPRAASVRDGNGRVPLVLAIDKGVYSYHDVLAHVFAAEPAAVTARDPITALFPFCIAALKTQSDCDDKEQQVSTIYQLLRIDPSVLVQS
jgi:hypothetical protein